MEQTLQFYSYVMAILSGLVFWAGFFIFGMIAYRYSKVFEKQTFYLFMMIAPSGILLYSILLIIKAAVAGNNPGLNNIIQNIAYLFFVISVLLTMVAMLKFNSVINVLMKYKGEQE